MVVQDAVDLVILAMLKVHCDDGDASDSGSG